MRLFKGMSSGTTALIHPAAAPDQEIITRALDPVRGIGADLFVTVDEEIRAFTTSGEISPPSAVIRLAAAFLHSQAPANQRWDFTVEGLDVQVHLEGGEYVINHGPWTLPGGANALTAGRDSTIRFSGLSDPRPALRVGLGERTVAVCAVATAEELAAVDFRTPPQTDAPADLVAAITIMGERRVDLTNEQGTVVDSQNIGALQLRGFDPHVGEMYSADALAVAAAVAARTWRGSDAAREWVAVFGGGNTRVELNQHALASAHAEIFAEITWQESDLG